MENNDKSFFFTLLEQLPDTAKTIIVTLLTLGIVLMLLGIDFANPINKATDAYAEAIRLQSQNVEQFHEAVDRFEAIVEVQQKSLNQLAKYIGENNEAITRVEILIDDIDTRVVLLEEFKDNHGPR